MQVSRNWFQQCLTHHHLDIPYQCFLNATASIQYYISPYETLTEISAGCIIISVVVFLPVSSLLAEVVISRYKLVRYSLRVMWFLSIVSCALTITGYSLTTATSTLSTFRLFLMLLPVAILFGAFLASVIPLGIDQIITGSNNNISAFIQWMLWSIAVGNSVVKTVGYTAYTCMHYQESDTLIMILSLIPVFLLSVAIVLDFFFGHKLVQEPVTVNPVTLIFKVLKYAAKHKYPVRRSAFTYCDDQQPSRLDYGKSKYGGPFTTEQVEDVKTFWRVLLVLIVVSSLYLLLSAITHVLIVYTNCIKTVLLVTTESSSLAIYFIPVYELLVYPCLGHRGPRILQSIGIGAAALIFSSLYGATAETVQYFTSNGTTQCLLTHHVTCYPTYIPYRACLGLAILLITKSTLEFICAQAPYNMRGILIEFPSLHRYF